jgi:hypothetical protein
MIEFTYKLQGDGRDSWGVKEFKDGELVNAFMIYEEPIHWLTKKLSEAFEAKFETYWKSKGYSDLSDLNGHSIDISSIYNQEALSLIRWSNRNWEIAVSGLNENSNIQEIINGLELYQ